MGDLCLPLGSLIGRIHWKSWGGLDGMTWPRRVRISVFGQGSCLPTWIERRDKSGDVFSLLSERGDFSDPACERDPVGFGTGIANPQSHLPWRVTDETNGGFFHPSHASRPGEWG
jgi:hypothetical protein